MRKGYYISSLVRMFVSSCTWVLQDPKVLITRRYNKAVEVQARIQRKEVTVYYSSYA